MQVNFKGFKNIGYFGTSRSAMQRDELPKSNCDIINIQLTDDYNGKDLTQYKELIKKKYPWLKNETNPDFLNFILWDKDILVNFQPVKVNDSNLDLMTLLANFLRKIACKQQKDFELNKDYLDSDDLSEGFLPMQNIKDLINNDKTFEQLAMTLHNPSSVKKGAKSMLDEFTQIMMDYFNS